MSKTPTNFLVVLFCCSAAVCGDAVPERIVCLAPSFVETLIELGQEDKIVGVTTSSDYLKEVENAERVGLWVKPNIEKILSLKPDIVLATGFVGQKPTADKLRSLGVRVMVIEALGTEDIFVMVKQLGNILGVRERSEELIGRMNKVIAQTKSRTDGLSRPRVYVEAGYNPLFTCGNGSFIHDLVEMAGGDNIAGDIDQPFPRVSSEFVISKDPEVIILPYMNKGVGSDSLKKRKGWEKISAVKTGRIYDDTGSYIVTIPSPRLIFFGLPALFKRIQPRSAEEMENDKVVE